MRKVIINLIFVITLITATAIVFFASYKGYDIKVAFIMLGVSFIPGLLINKSLQRTYFTKWVQIITFTVIIMYYIYVMYI